MAERKLPDIEDLRNALSYCPDTGILTWKWRADVPAFTNGRMAGKPAGTVNGEGYVVVGFRGALYSAHRIAFAIHSGVWPADQIDHINGVRDDNRAANLRQATAKQNHRNRRRSAKNTSGCSGVHFAKMQDKWVAQIKVSGRKKHIGSFEDFDAAVSARKAAEVEFGFHVNHDRV